MFGSQKVRRIVLTGFMGAGKSTIGPLLAKRLNWDFVDIDTAIEARAGKTVAEIFSQDGESAFRKTEAETIRDCCQRGELVMAPGGGAIETESTRDLLAGDEGTCVVFLDAPLDVLIARCLTQANGAERPVLADREKLLSRFRSRIPYYRSAHMTVMTADLTPDEVVDRIFAGVSGSAKSGADFEAISQN